MPYEPSMLARSHSSLCADSCRPGHVFVQAIIKRSYIPNIVNTQMLIPFQNVDPQVKVAFPGVNVNDRDRANVRPPNPSLCVGNGFVIEATDLVRCMLDRPMIGGIVLSTADPKGKHGAYAMRYCQDVSHKTRVDRHGVAC